MHLDVNVQQNGYIYIFVANESMADIAVYFDDMRVQHTESPATSASDYYPFGLTMINRSYTSEPYRFGYQGQFAEYDEETGWNSFELRQYDPVIGRWTTVDPKRQYWSPYLAMGNNPVKRMDPDGGGDGDGESEETSGDGLNRIIEFLSNLFLPMGSFMNDNYDSEDPEVISEVNEVISDKAFGSVIAEAEISPYISISLGKQSCEKNIFPELGLSFNGTLLITPNGVYITPSLDFSKDYSPLLRGTSLSLSGGIIVGPERGLFGPGWGYGGGSFVGMEYGSSYDRKTRSIGFVLTTTPLWGSLNTGWTAGYNKNEGFGY